MNTKNQTLTNIDSEWISELTSLRTKNKVLVERYAKLSKYNAQIQQDNAVLKQELLNIAAEKAELDKLLREICQVTPTFVEVLQVILKISDFVQGRNSSTKAQTSNATLSNNEENVSVRARYTDAEESDEDYVENNDDTTEPEVDNTYQNGHLSVIMEESRTSFVQNSSQKEMRISLKRLSMGECLGNNSTTSTEALTNDSIRDVDITVKELERLDTSDNNQTTDLASIENRSNFESGTTELTRQTLTCESNFQEQNKSLLVSPIIRAIPTRSHETAVLEISTPSLSALGDIEGFSNNSLSETLHNHLQLKHEPKTSIDSPKSSRKSQPRKRLISSVINSDEASSRCSSDEERENSSVSKRKRKTTTKKKNTKSRSLNHKKTSSSMSLEETVRDVQNRLSNFLHSPIVSSDTTSSTCSRPRRAAKPTSLKEPSLTVKLRREF